MEASFDASVVPFRHNHPSFGPSIQPMHVCLSARCNTRTCAHAHTHGSSVSATGLISLWDRKREHKGKRSPHFSSNQSVETLDE